MTDPKVGMKFGSYQKSKKNLEKSYEQNGNQFFAKNGELVATTNYTVQNNFLIFGVKDNTTNLTYSGTVRAGTSTEFHKFTMIQGKNIVADDLNRNGKVDENELFKIQTRGDGSKYYINENGKQISI